MPRSQGREPALQRRINVPLLVLYGLGTTIGAGIYVMIGATAGKAGAYTPLVFLLASVMAGFSAASFAELSTRFPVSAGEAAYIRGGLGLPNLSLLIGLAIASSGAISSATLLQGGVGYLQGLVEADKSILFLALLLALGGIAAWGIAQSMILAAIFTIVEILGLCLIIVYAPADPATLTLDLFAQAPPLSLAMLSGISGSILLAFFAFIGFEDMVNVVEEVKKPKRTMPMAIFLTLGITTLLYLWIAIIAVSVVPPVELGKSPEPLSLVVRSLDGLDNRLISLAAIAAVLNGVVIQIIMASRVLYGLGNLGQLPPVFARVSGLTHTPLVATATVCLTIVLLGLTLPLTALAATTSSFTLAGFALVNLSLWRLKGKEPVVEGAFHVPRSVPLLGFLISAGFLILQLVRKALSEI